MSRATTQSSTGRALDRRATPFDLAALVSGRWQTLVAVYLASRVFSTGVLFAVYEIGSLAGATFITPGSDRSFLDFTSSWDAARYRTIALHGYPSELPTDANGDVLPNEWAFLPVFPYLCHLLMIATGMDFVVAAPLLATLFGAGAAVLLYRLLVTKVGHRSAFWAVLLFCFGPMSFVLSVGYAESLFLVLVFGGLLAMQRRNYPLVAVAGIVAAFVRPGALALALALAIHLVVRWHTERPATPAAVTGATADRPASAVVRVGRALRSFVTGGTMPRRELVTVVVAGLAMAAAGLAWPVVAHLATGDQDAYLQTEMAWWVDYVGRPDFVPLTPWFLLAGRWLGIGGIALVLLIVASFAFWLTRRSTAALGHEVVGFVGSFGAYLLAVFLPQQSLFRLLMPLSPLLGSPAISSRPWLRRSMLVTGATLQPVAVVFLFLLVAP